jgi:hypothetical protein
MPKDKPPDTTTHTLHVPDELDRKLKMLAKYGTVDNFIVKCIEEGLAPRWKEYVAQEYARLKKSDYGENGQEPIRRSSPPDAGEVSSDKRRRKSS